jgi:hypothetical protein
MRGHENEAWIYLKTTLFWVVTPFDAAEFCVPSFEVTFLPFYTPSYQQISRSTSTPMMKTDQMSETLMLDLHHADCLRGF